MGAKRSCSIAGCSRPHSARGWCSGHWKQWRIHGDPLANRNDDWVGRFWEGVDKRGPDECWPWTKGRSPRGYGSLTVNGRKMKAHRASYLLAHGELSDDAVVCHHCDNPPCVNPAHLYAGTHATNAADRSQRKPHSWPRGEGVGTAKLSEAEALAILRAYRSGDFTLDQLADRYGVSGTAVWRIAHGRSWRHLQQIVEAGDR